MNREEIIRLAEEAGFEFARLSPVMNTEIVEIWLAAMAKFAALVAAAEREACARVCEDTDIVNFEHCMVLHDDAARTLRNAATAIRARGEK